MTDARTNRPRRRSGPYLAALTLVIGCATGQPAVVPPTNPPQTPATQPQASSAEATSSPEGMEEHAAKLRALASQEGVAGGGADANSYVVALMKAARGNACMFGLRVSLEILGKPSKPEAEKHIQACEVLHSPLPIDVTPSRALYFADARRFAATSNEAAELALVQMKLYASAYAEQWKTVDLPGAARTAWGMGCVDAARIRAGQANPSETLVGACVSAPEAEGFRDAIEAALSAAREP